MNLPVSVSCAVLAGFLTCCFPIDARVRGAQAVPSMTIELHNDSDTYSIYPVLSTGGHIVDAWLQAAFNVPKTKLADNPYPTPHTFRFYINPTGTGIPPHGSVTVTLPLYTQLVPAGQVNPKMADQYVDWWNGGRISLYASLYSDGAPPKALQSDYIARPTQNPITPAAGAVVPTCTACQQPLELFEDTGGELPSNDPVQITEYTLGAIDLSKDPYKLDVKNVDYDVSYVDNAYLPAAMEPHNNPVVGWIGTIQGIDPFKAALQKFLATPAFKGWPQYLDDEGETILRVPSALHIMLDQANLTPAPPWAPIENMKTLWSQCTAGGADPICAPIRNIHDLFAANYANYINNYSSAFSGTCDQSKAPVTDPKDLDEDAMLAHVYGWGPFNANCSAETNLLEDTPGYRENNYAQYQAVKSDFDALNYWPTGEFNPYVQLIHDPQYLNAQYVYAYSVDDAVGNMQTTGDGLIIAVGGTGGLPNPNPATSPIHVSFGDSPANAIRFVRYGVCTDTPDQDVNPSFASYDLSANQIASCVLSFLDNQNTLYVFKITSQPPYPPVPPAGQPVPAENRLMIDCSGNPERLIETWCQNIYGFSEPATAAHKREDDYIAVPAPAQPPRKGRPRRK